MSKDVSKSRDTVAGRQLFNVTKCSRTVNRARVTAVLLSVIAVLMIGCCCIVIQPIDRDDFIIIHTNDTHCHYGDDGSLGFTTVKSIKNQLESDGKTAFLIDAGDFLQGNAYGEISFGMSSVEIMNSIGYDVGIPGNHDFDYSLEVLLEWSERLNYPLICSNLFYRTSGESVFPQYKVLEKSGVKIGCFGLLTEETLDMSATGSAILQIADPIDAAESMVSLLKGLDVDYIVGISHLGVGLERYTTSDTVCSAVEGIDVMIDGHSHTEMEYGKVCDGSVDLLPSDSVIASTGAYLHNVGMITVSGKGNVKAELYRGPAIHDGETDAVIDGVLEELDGLLSEYVCHTDVYLDGEWDDVRSHETNLGDLIADSFRMITECQVAIVNAASISESLDEGDIITHDIYDMYPYINDLVMMDVKGSDIYKVMEYSYGLALPNDSFLQISGIEVKYDLSREKGSRVVSIAIGGEPLDPDGTYSLVTNNYVALGGGGYTMFADYQKEIACTATQAITAYLTLIGNITEDTIIGDRQVPV